MTNNSSSRAYPNMYDDLSNFIAQIQPSIIQIPFKTKKVRKTWKSHQTNVTSNREFKFYKKKNIKSNCGIITGRILQGPYGDKYLTVIDSDNRKSILNYAKDV